MFDSSPGWLDSLRELTQGLSGSLSHTGNAQFTFTKYSQPTIVQGKFTSTGNYLPLETTVTLKGYLRSSKDPNLELQHGVDIQRIYMIGAIFDEDFYLNYPLYKKENIATIVQGQKGKFNIVENFIDPIGYGIQSQRTLGTKIEGYFYLT